MLNFIQENICDIWLTLLIVCLGFSLIYCTINLSNYYEEKECVKFYEKHDHVLNGCKKYFDK